MKKFLLITLLLLVIAPVVLFQTSLAPQIGDFKVMMNTIFGGGIDSPDDAAVKRTLQVPDGIGIRLYAADIKNARGLLATSNGGLLVSTPRSGEVWLLAGDADGDGRSDGRQVLLGGLNRPHGLLLLDGWLYIAETDAVGRIAFDGTAAKGEFERVLTGLPGGGNHYARSLASNGDSWIYINIGSSCNVCIEEDSRRGSILRFRPDGSGEEVFADGLRNSMAMAFSPFDGKFYAADIARDLLGDDFPVDELNVIEKGRFYGWPLSNDFGVPDPDLAAGNPAKAKTAVPPVLGFPAHTSPLDIHFFKHRDWQKRFPKSALVTLHGSWNRSKPDGYRVVMLSWGNGGQIASANFLTGFLQNGEVTGRPVEITEAPDGTLYLSDDYAGAIYAIAPGQSSLTDFETAGTKAGGVGNRSFDAALLSQGAALFERYACASCHQAGAIAEGASLIPLQNLSARYSVEELADFLKTPNPPMPVFPLQAGERTSLASFLLHREYAAATGSSAAE